MHKSISFCLSSNLQIKIVYYRCLAKGKRTCAARRTWGHILISSEKESMLKIPDENAHVWLEILTGGILQQFRCLVHSLSFVYTWQNKQTNTVGTWPTTFKLTHSFTYIRRIHTEMCQLKIRSYKYLLLFVLSRKGIIIQLH